MADLQAPANGGLPSPDDSADRAHGMVAWPPDAFTALTTADSGPRPIGEPARHSYDGDGNMEALSAFPPFARQEDRTDLARYTGAVGPAGGSTPEAHPELTAP